jgi:HAD superfamily hydrolase (TIGR01509 family)
MRRSVVGQVSKRSVNANMLEGIIFDMDGVLINSHPVHRDAWRKFLSTVGKDIADDDLDFILEGRRREEILRHFFGELPEEIVAEYGHRKDQLFQANFDSVQVVPGVRTFLERLKAAGMPASIATSASSGRTRATLRSLKLENVFVAVVTGDDVQAGKPDPAVYRLASEQMNLPPEELLALEDAPCGVRAARSAGIRCIGVATNGHTDALLQAGADRVIPNFLGLTVEKMLDIWNEIHSHDTRSPSHSSA